MAKKIICPYGCGAVWSSHTNRRAKLPLDEKARKAANETVWRECPHIKERGSKSQITMERHDYWCRKKWMDAYLKALEKPKPKPKPSPSSTAKPKTECKTARLVIKVIDHDGKPIKDAIVYVNGIGGFITDDKGYADYGEVDARTYEVTAEKKGYTPIPRNISKRATEIADVPPCQTTVIDLSLTKESRCKFDLSVNFVGNSDDGILTPFSVSDYDELKSGKTKNQDHVKFDIEIKQNKVDKLSVKITKGKGSKKKRIYYKELKEHLRVVGKHEWPWSGFSDSGILDTEVLKDPDLTFEVKAELCGVTKKKIIKLNNEYAEQDWVNVVINKNTKKIIVKLRVDIKDGGESGVGELPPSDVQKLPMYKALPASDHRKQKHVRIRSFANLRQLVLSGIEKYWSRSISTPDGTYTVKTKPIATTKKTMDDINVEYNTNNDWMYSMNPGKVRGFYSLFANVLPERAVYNVGWIEYDNGWGYQNPNQEDKEFEETSAHEIGHEILSAYGGDSYSYGHRGSSTIVTQSKKDLGSGGVSYPSSGEIDLMKYYHGTRPTNFFSRVVASETDVKSFIWLSRVEFDD